MPESPSWLPLLLNLWRTDLCGPKGAAAFLILEKGGKSVLRINYILLKVPDPLPSIWQELKSQQLQNIVTKNIVPSRVETTQQGRQEGRNRNETSAMHQCHHVMSSFGGRW